MEITARIVCDSISAAGVRLLTVEAYHPRFILAEVNTHRVITKNGASSRAIPFPKMVEAIRAGYARPIQWLKNQPGMVATVAMEDAEASECDEIWLEAMEDAIKHATRLHQRGASKQYVNRLLEPWMMQRTLMSSTRWANFFKLRDEPGAQPEFQALAKAIKAAMAQSKPVLLKPRRFYDADLYLPYVDGGDWLRALDYIKHGGPVPFETLDVDWAPVRRVVAGVAVARCCRVTTRLVTGNVSTVEDDMTLCAKLTVDPLHASPFEHIAFPLQSARAVPELTGNYHGWGQLRKMLPGEALDEAA